MKTHSLQHHCQLECRAYKGLTSSLMFHGRLQVCQMNYSLERGTGTYAELKSLQTGFYHHLSAWGLHRLIMCPAGGVVRIFHETHITGIVKFIPRVTPESLVYPGIRSDSNCFTFHITQAFIQRSRAILDWHGSGLTIDVYL